MYTRPMPETPDNIVPITPDARTAAEKFSAEHDRELLTILFTDLVDSTKLQSEAGNVEAARLVELHRRIVRDELAKYDAREIEWAGDSCLAVFTKPSDAVVFALRMQSEHRHARETEPKLPTVRVGMHLGEIVVKKGDTKTDLFGLQVSEAARVMSVARGNQIFCTRAVFDNARGALKGSTIEGIGEVIWVNYGAYILKGSEDAIELCEVGSSEVAVLKAPQPSDKVSPLLPEGATVYHPLVPSEGVSASTKRTSRWMMAVLTVVAVAIGVVAGRNIPGPERQTLGEQIDPEIKPLIRLSINLDHSQDAAVAGRARGLALSPDGSLLVYSTGSLGESRLVVRRMDQLDAQAIPGTDGGGYPTFSPDGEWIVYVDFNDRKFKKISPHRGAPIILCDYIRGPSQTSWGDDGYIYFTGNAREGIWCVAEAGGERERVTSLRDGEITHTLPYPLPGGRIVLFSAVGEAGADEISIGAFSYETGETKTLLMGARHPTYLPSGHLLYETPGELMAAPFDSERAEFTGPAVPVGENNMIRYAGNRPAQFAVSASGSFAYTLGSGNDMTIWGSRLLSLVWVDLEGNETPLDAPPKLYDSLRISPDGRYAAVEIRVIDPDGFDPDDGSDLWVYDLERLTRSRLTFDNDAVETFPVWTPDGTRIVYRVGGAAADGLNLFWKSADGTDDATLVTSRRYFPEGMTPYAWTPDGEEIVVGRLDSDNNVELVVISPESDDEPHVLLDTPFQNFRARISPDGRWIAYVSNFSDQSQVYVQSFPEMKGRWQISTDGGMDPIWSPDGSEIYYRAGQAVMAVPVETEPVFRAGIQRMLFEGEYEGHDSNFRPYYDLAPDGERFLMLKPVENAESSKASSEIVIVQNWLENLERLVPVPKGN